jgi:uncharacterized protein
MDDLNTPLGQTPAKPKFRIPVRPGHAIVAVLALFLLAFVAVAALNTDPLGGEPVARVAVSPPADETPAAAPAAKSAATPTKAPTASGSRTITIIDGSSGKRQEVTIPAGGEDATSAGGAKGSENKGGDPSLLENSRYGALPIVGPGGIRPSKAYAARSNAAANAPSVAIVVTGLGIGATRTTDAIMKLPPAVTLSFTPYGAEPAAAIARARAQGHEVLMQIPMEPFDYPDNDPGPQTLLAASTPEQNLERLQFHMSRFQGYVGLANFMGARFSTMESALKPVMQEAAKRGLIYFDDGATQRSVTRQVAEGMTVPFATADLTIDAVPSAGEIDKTLGKLEAIAKQRGVAIGVASGLPASIDRIAAWAKALESRGIALVPLTAALPKAKSS